MFGCASSSSENIEPAYRYVQPDTGICDVSKQFTEGLLCALKPSRLDSAARDVYGNSTTEDLAYGFGYHVIAFPKSGTKIRGVYVHLGGSLSRPYDQDAVGLASKELLLESLTSGFIMIQLAYNNRFAVNSANECGGSNIVIDNCAGDLRREKITGSDISTVGDTPMADSIEHRLKVLVDYLVSVDFKLPVTLVNDGVVDWSSVRLGGHSQGAGHALYVKKYLKGGQVCLLAGMYDIADSVPSVSVKNMADWLLDESAEVDISSLRAILSVDDPSYSYFTTSYAQLGMVENIHWESINSAPYTDGNHSRIGGHAAPLKDPRFSSNRKRACFD